MEQLAQSHVKGERDAAEVLADASSARLIERLVQIWMQRVGTRVADGVVANRAVSSPMVSPESVVADLEDSADTETDLDSEGTVSSGDEAKGAVGSERLPPSTPTKQPATRKKTGGKGKGKPRYHVLKVGLCGKGEREGRREGGKEGGRQGSDERRGDREDAVTR